MRLVQELSACLNDSMNQTLIPGATRSDAAGRPTWKARESSAPHVRGLSASTIQTGCTGAADWENAKALFAKLGKVQL